MSTLQEKVKAKVPEQDVNLIVKRCDETIKWLDANQTAEKEEYEAKQKELEGEFNPIITRLYGAGGGGEEAPGGGDATRPGAPAGGAQGPTIEEVD